MSVDTGVGVSRCRGGVGVVSGSGVEVSSQGSKRGCGPLTKKGCYKQLGNLELEIAQLLSRQNKTANSEPTKEQD